VEVVVVAMEPLILLKMEDQVQILAVDLEVVAEAATTTALAALVELTDMMVEMVLETYLNLVVEAVELAVLDRMVVLLVRVVTVEPHLQIQSQVHQ
tara:strand:+ start:212 stop:499 length:288 start_codon:yes stop_codon:yes gene_type:complete